MYEFKTHEFTSSGRVIENTMFQDFCHYSCLTPEVVCFSSAETQPTLFLVSAFRYESSFVDNPMQEWPAVLVYIIFLPVVRSPCAYTQATGAATITSSNRRVRIIYIDMYCFSVKLITNTQWWAGCFCKVTRYSTSVIDQRN
jgi:hypothetical protein